MARIQCFANCRASGSEFIDARACLLKAVHAGVDWVGVEVGDEGRMPVDPDMHPLAAADELRGSSLLADAIKIVEGSTGLHIAINGTHAASHVVRQIHNAIFRRTWKHAQFIVSSPDFSLLKMVQCYDPNIRTGCMVLGAPLVAISFAVRMGVHCVFIDKTHVTPGLVEDCHRQGVEVVARVVNSEEEFLLMEAMEIDGVVSDFPDRIVAWRLPRYRGKRLAICE
jgi:hypothetical protein